MINRLPDETDKAWAAFQDFLRLGTARSLAELKEQYVHKKSEKIIVPTTSQGTLLQWSSKFNWFERAGQWDLEQEKQRAQALQEKKESEWIRSLEAYQKRTLQTSQVQSQICLNLCKKVLITFSKKKANLTVDQALRAISAIAKLTEVSQGAESNALGVSQILTSLAAGKETPYSVASNELHTLNFEEYSDAEIKKIRETQEA